LPFCTTSCDGQQVVQVPATSTVGTLRTGYHRVQASSQDNGSDSRLSAGGNSGTATRPHGSGSHLPAQGSYGAATCPHGFGVRPLAWGSSGATACHLGSSTHLLAQGSSAAVTCPEEGLCRLQAIKQISPGDLAIMISRVVALWGTTGWWRSHRCADGDHGPLHWSLLPYHLWHRLRLPLRILHHILRESFRGLGLAVRSWPWSCPDSCICGSGAYGRSSHAHRDGCTEGRGPVQKV
jgi:hypothetical protein